MMAFQICVPGWAFVAIVALLLIKFAVEVYLITRVYRLLVPQVDRQHEYS